MTMGLYSRFLALRKLGKIGPIWNSDGGGAYLVGSLLCPDLKNAEPLSVERFCMLVAELDGLPLADDYYATRPTIAPASNTPLQRIDVQSETRPVYRKYRVY